MSAHPLNFHLIAAARPNFMKVAPLFHALKAESWCRPILVHSGQHYDDNMSEQFLRDLKLGQPDFHLGVDSGEGHSTMTGRVMIEYEKLCQKAAPDWIVVVGDVNSTLACALVGAKLGKPVAHLEAGLRSGDRSMPEEINRLATDAVADVLWTPSPDADRNLRGEGVAKKRISRVGNIMMDSYELMRPAIEAIDAAGDLGLAPASFGVVTLHRPANVDQKAVLADIVERLEQVAKWVDFVFPVHPRTRQRLESFGLMEQLRAIPGARIVEPMSYIPFMSTLRAAKFVITDSGGLQEETTYLDIPCITLRPNTERPITVKQGTNRLTGLGDLLPHIDSVMAGNWPSGRRPDLWDGRTAARIVADLKHRTQICY